MVCVQTRQDLEFKGKLLQLRLLQVDGTLSDCNQELSDLRHAHIRSEENRKDALVREQDRARRREAKEERLKTRRISATTIQAHVRSHFARRFVLPDVLEAKATEELERSRIALTETMLGLHQNIHDLAFLEQDHQDASTHIQAWWRGVLAKRVVAIIIIRNHLNTVRTIMDEAATCISAIVRGRQARMGCYRLRMEKEKRMQQAKKMQSDRMVKSVIKIQSHVRRRAAIKATKARRAMLAKELEGDSGSPTSDARIEASRRAPDRGDRTRRKRNAESHGNSTSRQRGGAHPESTSQALPAFEGGAMALPETEHPAELRRKSYGANHVHKVKKVTRKLQALGAVRPSFSEAK